MSSHVCDILLHRCQQQWRSAVLLGMQFFHDPKIEQRDDPGEHCVCVRDTSSLSFCSHRFLFFRDTPQPTRGAMLSRYCCVECVCRWPATRSAPHTSAPFMGFSLASCKPLRLSVSRITIFSGVSACVSCVLLVRTLTHVFPTAQRISKLICCVAFWRCALWKLPIVRMQC